MCFPTGTSRKYITFGLHYNYIQCINIRYLLFFFLKIYQAVAMPLIAKRGLRSSCCPAGEMLSSCPCRSCCFFCWVKIDDGSKPINKKHTFGGDEHPPTRRYQSLGRYLITSHFSSPPILVMFSWSSSGWKVVSEHNLRKLCDQAKGAVGYWWGCCQPVARQNLGLTVTTTWAKGRFRKNGATPKITWNIQK